jgi:hypothetical protein
MQVRVLVTGSDGSIGSGNRPVVAGGNRGYGVCSAGWVPPYTSLRTR